MWDIRMEICVAVLVLVIAFGVSSVKGDCGEIPPVDYVRHNLTGVDPPYPTNTLAVLSCQRGYTQSGYPYRVCAENGTWMGRSDAPFRCSPKSCGNPGTISNGEKDSYVYTVGRTVVYTCYEGFELVGRDRTLCLASGSWSNPAPTCNPIVCPALPSPANGRLVGTDRGYGKTIRLECDEGYKATGPDTRVCQRDKSWTNQPFVCQEIDCGPPSKVPNAEVTLLDGTTYGNGAHVRCFENATSSSDLAFNTIFCGDLGQWTSPQECWACCNVEHVVNNSSVAFIPGEGCVPHGESRRTSVYSCQEGFYVSSPAGSPGRTRCQAGVMSVNLTCEAIVCKIPEINFGRVLHLTVGEVVEYGTSVAVECDRGYNLTSGSTVVCNSRSVSYPSCLPACCNVERVVNDSSVAFIPGEGCVPHGESRLTSVYSCQEGFYVSSPAGSPGRTRCQAGVMSVNLTCEAIVCKIPEINFGRVLHLTVGEVVEYGTSVAVECDRGYNLTSGSTVVCNSRSVSYPSCLPACCNVERVVNDSSVAFIPGEGCVPHGESRRTSVYSCQEGFYVSRPAGSPGRTRCQAGVMSVNLTCEAIMCKIPEVNFGRVLHLEVDQVVEYGTSMAVECDRGYNLTSGSTVVCNSRSVSYPSCLPACCNVERVPSNSSVAFIPGEGCVPHGESRQLSVYSCQEGFYVSRPADSPGSARCERGVMSVRFICLPIECKIPEIDFGRVSNLTVGHVVEYGRTMAVECDRGYNLTSASTVVCSSQNVNYPRCQPASCSLASRPDVQISSVESDCLMVNDKYVRHGCNVLVGCGDGKEVARGSCQRGQWQVQACGKPEPEPRASTPPWVIVVSVIAGIVGAGVIGLIVAVVLKNSKKIKMRNGTPNEKSEVVRLQKKEPVPSKGEGEPV